ncbi:hypothetical protein [Asanoa siamensis]|uniref:Antibiotic biosynthesis monooxygenase n=1 Tax=Asanoa siamensis TaxID=926357 RepID=A0ABQ4D3E1_9ACTN|nr:hypothetical protein [Asanoa siamensis]GIF78058.1 hypothetical protein Asi02nite_75760 [Asanoa siamensis]
MFVQIIQGHVRDAGQLKAAIDDWVKFLSPGAEGWLSSTGGVTDSGDFIGLACFTDAASAQHNSERPDQDAWWQRTSQLFDGPVQFHNADNAVTDNPGEPLDAQFVQIMQGHGTDHDRAMELMLQDQPEWATFRPDILGTTACAYGDGDFTVAVYFTNEAEARAGERKKPPPELHEQLAELQQIMVGKTAYYDLHHPWIQAP